jgi:hypothetical protein
MNLQHNADYSNAVQNLHKLRVEVARFREELAAEDRKPMPADPKVAALVVGVAEPAAADFKDIAKAENLRQRIGTHDRAIREQERQMPRLRRASSESICRDLRPQWNELLQAGANAVKAVSDAQARQLRLLQEMANADVDILLPEDLKIPVTISCTDGNGAVELYLRRLSEHGIEPSVTPEPVANAAESAEREPVNVRRDAKSRRAAALTPA